MSLAVAFAAGILVQDLSGLHPLVGWIVAGGTVLAGLILWALRTGGSLRFFAWLLAFFSLGLARGNLPAPPEAPASGERVILTGTARSGWESLPDRRRIELEAESIRMLHEKPGPVEATVRVSVFSESSEQNTGEAIPCPEVLPGDKIRVLARVGLPRGSHNPGVVDFSRMIRRRGIDWTASVSGCRYVMVEPSSGSLSPGRWIESARYAIRDFLSAREGAEASKAIVLAVTTGQKGKIPEASREDFQRAGLAHLLAISGLHLGFVALGLYLLLVKLFTRFAWLTLRFDVRRLAACLVVPATLFYTVLSGAHLPAVRACIMVLCFLVAVILRRQSDPLQILFAAALIILGLWPQSLFEVSFQLSFSAVFFILVGMPVLTQWFRVPLSRQHLEDPWIRRWGVRAFHLLLVSLAATLGTAPLVAYHFNQVSLAGLCANLIAVPLTAWLIVPLGLCAIVLLPLSAVLAGWVADCAIGLAGGLAEFAAWVSDISWVSFAVTTPSIIQTALLYGVFLVLLKWRQGRTRWVLTALALLILTGWWVAGRLAPRLSDDMEVTFLDVGQADSALVRFPCGKTLLVDGGDAREGGFDSGRMVVAPFLWGRGISQLDYVAVTHPQSDHAGGLPSVVRLFHPREIWTTQRLSANPVTVPLDEAAREVGSREVRMNAETGSLLVCGCTVEVVWPPDAVEGLDLNERSLVLRISHGDISFLLAGDLEGEGEEGLLRTDANLRASVLKAGHHGSRHASSRELIDRVGPVWAVVSVGEKNVYGMPHRELLARIKESKVRLLRTDRNGAVTFRTDGDELEVECYRDPDGINCRM